jgi:hypothetical protein
MQRKLWEIITDNQEEKPDTAIRCISELHKLSQSLCQMYEMLPLLGNLPSNAFTGLVDVDDNNGGETTDKASVITTPQPTTTSSSLYICGNSAGMYNLRHDID